MRSLLLPGFMVFAGFLATPALADPAYTAEQLVEKFSAAIDAGEARGICVGTEAECGAAEAEVQAMSVQDLVVTFGLDSVSLTDEAKANLDQFAEALRDPGLSNVAFAVEGHTDALGTEAYNLDLSERRAAAVVEYLQSLGVDTSKLTVIGRGMSQPRTDDPFDPENRRVEARLLQQ